jgi:uncharacterized protein (TIGR00251 family)
MDNCRARRVAGRYFGRMVDFRPTATGVRFAVTVQPRASRTEVVGEHGEMVKIRIAAPPVEGAANEELIRFLAKQLHVPASAVRVVSGQSARRKVVEVEGVAPEHARATLLA